MISVDFGQQNGLIKPVNGISCYDSGHAEQFFNYGFPSVRLHDQDGARPFVVDIAAIFPFFGADVNSPDSYDFRDTDRIITDLVSHDVQVIYRLGNTIDHTPFPRLSEVPKDFLKWAKICEHIILHYNEGWKNGFHYDLQYWEIWNEPDLIYLNLYTMWQGTEEEFFGLYQVAAAYLKGKFPTVKIGGYGAARSRAPFFEHFLQFIQREKLPLDFFTWHRYGSEVEEVVAQAKRVREMLDQYGYQHAESILDEWNYTENDFFGQNSWGLYGNNATIQKAFFTRMRSEVGASYDLAVLIELLDAPVDSAQIYDGQRGNFGILYDYYGAFTKVSSALFAFNALAKRKHRVAATSDAADVRVVASQDEKGVDILVSCFECKGNEDQIVVQNLQGVSFLQVMLINDFFDYKEVAKVEVQDGKAVIPVSIRPYTVIHICSEEV